MARDLNQSSISTPRRGGMALCSLMLLLLPLALLLSGDERHAGSRTTLQASPDALDTARRATERELLRPIRYSSESSESWALNNPLHQLQAMFSSNGWQLEPLEQRAEPVGSPAAPASDESKWRWRYKLSSLSRGESRSPVAAPAVSGDREQVTLNHGGAITEWYKNKPAGIEQGFEIKERPLAAVAGRLELRGSVDTDLALVSSSDRHVEFGRSGTALVRYAELAVFDASGAVLPSWMSFRPSAEGGELALLIDDSRAQYPVTVDPVTSSPLWTKNGAANGDQFGYSVASAGDVNGDNFADVIVGAPEYSNGQMGEGVAYIFLGSATGPSTNPSYVIEGNEGGARFGWSVAPAGDVNGDGFSDVIIGAPYADCGPFTDVGKAVVYAGSASGISQIFSSNNCSPNGAGVGWSVAGAGDVNNDGFSDILIGCPACLSNLEVDGKAFLHLGSAGGPSAGADWSYPLNDDIVGGGAANFGLSVAGAGDVNNDGFSDILAGAPNWDGMAQGYLFLGSGSGPSNAPDWTHNLTVQTTLVVASGGDTNGDGFDDVIVGAKNFNFAAQGGIAELFFGSATGPSTLPDWTELGSGNGTTSFGASAASAGDINGDGYDEVLVGSPDYDPGSGAVGKAFLFLGSASGPETTDAWYASGSDLVGSSLGNSVASAGDVNGDGFPDVIIGDQNRLALQGSAFIWDDFNIARATPTPTSTPTPTPTPTPISVSPGGGGLPAPQVSTSGRSATVTAPRVTAQLTTRARNAAIKKLMKQGLSRPQAIRALSRLTITYIFTLAQGGRASAVSASSDDVNTMASSITRRTKRNQVTFSRLPPGSRFASYRIEISTRTPPVVLGTTKPSGRTPFTITP